jgi:hypothetical protein
MGGGGHQAKLLRKKKKKTSFPSLVDVERAAQKEVAARVAARKAAAQLCREANIKRRLLQPEEVRTPSPVLPKPAQMVAEQAQKISAEEERLQRLQRLAKVRTDMMAKSRAAAAALRSSGKVEGTGAPRSLEAGVPTRSTAISPQQARANDNEYQGWLKQHGVAEGIRVFSLSGSVSGGKNKVLRQYLLDTGLYENTDPDSPHWDFKWILRRQDVDWRNVRPWQAVNSFEPTIDISSTHFVTKKLGLGRALSSSHWVGVNAAMFFPQQFDCNDAEERVAFIRAFVFSAAQAVLRRWTNHGEASGGLARMAASCTATHSVLELQQLQEAIRVCRIFLHEKRWLVDEHGDGNGDDDVEAQSHDRPDWSDVKLALVLADRDAAAAENCLTQTEAVVPAGTQVRLFAGAKESRASRLPRAEQTAQSTSGAFCKPLFLHTALWSTEKNIMPHESHVNPPHVSSKHIVVFKEAMAARTAARARYLDGQAQVREKKRLARMERCGMLELGQEPESEPQPEQEHELGLESDMDCCPGLVTTSETADPDEIRSAQQEARAVVASLAVCDPQWEILGRANVWVAKPASQSRGRGITVSASLAKLLKTMGHGLLDDGKRAPKREQMSMVEVMNSTTSTDWVVQKYVENPSLIDGKKWDLRMWAVVTSWDPLTVWWYLDGYLRFVRPHQSLLQCTPASDLRCAAQNAAWVLRRQCATFRLKVLRWRMLLRT